MCSILIDVTIVQSIFEKLSLTDSIAIFNFLQYGLSAKKPNVIINRWSTAVYTEKAHWRFAVSMLNRPVPLIQCCCMIHH